MKKFGPQSLSSRYSPPPCVRSRSERDLLHDHVRPGRHNRKLDRGDGRGAPRCDVSRRVHEQRDDAVPEQRAFPGAGDLQRPEPRHHERAGAGRVADGRHGVLLVLLRQQRRDHVEGRGRPGVQRLLLGVLRGALRRRVHDHDHRHGHGAGEDVLEHAGLARERGATSRRSRGPVRRAPSTVTPQTRSVASGGGSGTFTRDGSRPAARGRATSNATWISIVSGGSGTGNGTVSFSACAEQQHERSDRDVERGGPARLRRAGRNLGGRRGLQRDLERHDVSGKADLLRDREQPADDFLDRRTASPAAAAPRAGRTRSPTRRHRAVSSARLRRRRSPASATRGSRTTRR